MFVLELLFRLRLAFEVAKPDTDEAEDDEEADDDEDDDDDEFVENTLC